MLGQRMAALTTLALLALFLGAAAIPNFTVTPYGEPTTIWAAVDTLHRCNGLIDVPDIPARAFFDAAANTTRMVVGSTTYHRMSGPSLLGLVRDCAVAWNETGDPNPAHFAGDEFLDSTWAFPNGTVYSLVHTEYPGNVYHNCTISAYPTCWTVSVGLAVSHDAGATWAHARPPPAHLVAAVPYGYNQSQLASGWGDPSNLLEKDGYFYAALWNRNAVGLQAPGVCVARTADLSDPAAWRAWGGAAFDVAFASPYTLPPGAAGAHVCVPTNLPNCPVGGWAWSAPLGAYLAALDCSLQGGAHFYVAASDDLLHWGAPQTLYQASDLPADVRRNVTAMTYPTWLDARAPARGDANFATLGEEAYLSWVSIGHSPYTDGRRLWVTPVRFALA